jgi:hypothetical protein
MFERSRVRGLKAIQEWRRVVEGVYNTTGLATVVLQENARLRLARRMCRVYQ